jgi:uncharacterized SAM-binding protein YcdF (DUF218 family)
VRRAIRLLTRGALVVVGLVACYLVVTFVMVWMAGRQDHASRAGAIVVLGASQYNGVPSPVLRARLDHAAELYQRGLAPIVVVTGGRLPGDRFTEASAGARYLVRKGVPPDALLREVSSTSSWESLAASARFLERDGIRDVVLVSDPFHSRRISQIAGEVGLRAHTSPTRTSPIHGLAEARATLRETIAVSVGQIIGYRRLLRLDHVVFRIERGAIG